MNQERRPRRLLLVHAAALPARPCGRLGRPSYARRVWSPPTSAPDPDDLADLAAIRDGDPSRFARLVARHGPRVHDLARRLTRDAHLAEDLTQQAFLNAWRALARFDAARPFRHWILRITTNLCRNLHAARQLRPQAPQGPPGDPDAAPLDPPDPAPARADPEERARPAHVRAAIERLPERYRAPVVLYHLHGLPLEEVGAILDLPVATVKTHLHRGRAALRELLALPETGSGPAGTAG